MLGELKKGITDLIIPPVPKCHLCSRRRPKDAQICTVCQKELDYWCERYNECEICGRFIGHKGICPQCLEERPQFHRARAVGPYRGILKDCLFNLKFRGDRKLAVPLGKLLADKIKRDFGTTHIDFIVPVPMHPRRLHAKGYNHAALLAKEVGKILYKPVREEYLVKKEDTVPQFQLTQSERKTNLEASFTVRGKEMMSGSKVLIIDDIFTTGSTVSECTEELIDAGVECVFVGVVATGIYFNFSE